MDVRIAWHRSASANEQTQEVRRAGRADAELAERASERGSAGEESHDGTGREQRRTDENDRDDHGGNLLEPEEVGQHGDQGTTGEEAEARTGSTKTGADRLVLVVWRLQSRQLCRTHYTFNLMSVCPRHAWGGVKAMLHSVFDQIDTKAVHAQ